MFNRIAAFRILPSVVSLAIIFGLLFSMSFSSFNSAYGLPASQPLIGDTVTIPAMQKSLPVITDGDDATICDVAIDPTTNRLYISASNGILYIMKQNFNVTSDTDHDNVDNGNHLLTQLSTIDLGRGSCTSEIAINTRSNMIYVANTNITTDSLYVIDGQSNKVVEQISLADNNQTLQSFPSTVASQTSIGINPLSNRVYVNFGIPTITYPGNSPEYGTAFRYIYKTSVIDGNTNTILDENLTGVEGGPNIIAVDAELGKVYFAHTNARLNHSITIMKEGSDSNHTLGVLKKIEDMNGDVHSMAVNPTNNKLYVDTFDIYSPHENIINVIDGKTNEIIKSITLSNGTEGEEVYSFPSFGGQWMDITVNPNTNTVYATNMFLGTLYVIDSSTDKLVNRIETKADSSQLSFPDGANTAPIRVDTEYSSNSVYILHANSKAISLITGSEVLPEFGTSLAVVMVAMSVMITLAVASKYSLNQRTK